MRTRTVLFCFGWLWLAACGVWATPQPPTPNALPKPRLTPAVSTSLPGAIHDNVPCPHTEHESWAGPWESPEVSYYAWLSWESNAPEACLALLGLNQRGGQVFAQAQIPAGYSARYNEYYAPSLANAPLEFEGERPLIITARTTQGAGGGGGETFSVWRGQAARLAEILSFTLETYTGINQMVDAACALENLGYGLRQNKLEITSCLDGQVSQQNYIFENGQFFPTAP